MPQLTYPTGPNFEPQRFEFDLINDSVRQLASPFTGSVQTQETPWPRWRASLGYAPAKFIYGQLSPSGQRIADLRAFWSQARGMAGRVLLFNHERQVPLGTVRGSLTLSANVLLGDTSMVINAGAGQNGFTLRKGDFLGFGSNQLVRLVADATVSVGLITVQFEPPSKAAVAAGAAVTWDRPRALFRVMDNGFSVPVTPGEYGSSNVELLEV
jgi:hypothetical protein